MAGADRDRPGPMQAAQRAMRPPLPKRFYKTVSVGEEGGAFTVLLDGKAMRTPAKRLFALPVRALAEIAAREWDAQQSEIDPGTMPMTRLANLAIDRIAETASETAQEVKRYAASDLVLYRAGEPEGLVEEQAKHWDPVLRWADEALDAHFVLASGVNFVSQPDSSLQTVAKAVDAFAPPFALAALASVTQLTGSALIALMLGHGKIAPVAAWNAAHVDDDWNARTWGEDREATAKRALRLAEFEAAARMLSCTRAE
ncbi:MAG TPA: ATP12 family protein [Xanthobacteraceae bacterium]|nr:ATP12 family protein [Xanthobacteraceae bacterium]